MHFTEDAAWYYSLLVGISGGLIVSFLMGWEQWHMSREESAKINNLWHVPPWAISALISILLVYASYTGSNIREAYITAVTLTIPISLWCFIAIVFRRFL
jgi:hypothetical protein